ncbi:MAG: HAD family hydrolase [Chloroflexota bacterium]
MPLDISRIRAICFDVDGTLRDTDDQFVEQLVRRMNWARFFFPRRDPTAFARWLVMATETPGNFLLGLNDRLGIDDELAAIGDWVYYRLGMRGNAEAFLLIEGVHEMLARLQAHYPLAVVSARGRRSTYAFLERFGLLGYFQCIATGQTCAYTKPHPDPIFWAADQLDVPAANCLMVGDTTVDIRAGRAAGAQTVGVLCGFGEERELQDAGVDLILASTPGLADALGV